MYLRSRGKTGCADLQKVLHLPAGDAEEDDEDGEPGTQAAGSQKPSRRQAAPRDCDPSATLESSWEALNVKKLEAAFAVDPLFHKTSAQFDAGGARGVQPAQSAVQPVEVLRDQHDRDRLMTDA